MTFSGVAGVILEVTGSQLRLKVVIVSVTGSHGNSTYNDCRSLGTPIVGTSYYAANTIAYKKLSKDTQNYI